MAFSLQTIFGDPNKKTLKKYEAIVPKVNALEVSISALSDDALKAKTAEFRAKLAGKTYEEEQKILEEILPEAFAVVREASKRALGQRHFDVQLIGGAILNNKSIAEMRTGEGKTLVATLPAYLNALSGRGVHVITVNDYLSRRDGAWMGIVYNFLGLSVGIINHEASYLYDPLHKSDTLQKEENELGSFKVVHEFLRPVSRREAYGADITYGTNNEFGFDYLRDNLEYDAIKMRQRGFNFAIVDEVDSILIDEARTPLIISAPTVDSENLYSIFTGIVSGFVKDLDYTVDEKHKSIALLPSGIEKAEKSLGIENIYTDKGIKLSTTSRQPSEQRRSIIWILST
jgi:preprotein translocase subunit SecA